jgi:hypothetical protein
MIFQLSLSPLRRSRVGMKLYFPFHTLENVNIWKFINYKFELERGLPSANAESLALLPS